jgi:hypothetical protein
MTQYEVADARLTGRCKTQRKVANHTYLIRRGGDIAVKLHATDVVTLHPDGSITLNSGGWHTPTTKERMTHYYGYQTGHRYGLHSIDGVWLMHDGSLFYDGVTIDPDGNIIDPRPVTDYVVRLKALKKEIRAYAKAFAANSKDIALPSSGDCWGCSLQVSDSDPANRVEPMGMDHYHEHMEEGYYVPSLLGNAIRSKRYGSPAFIYQLCQTGTWVDTYSLIYKFMLKQMQPELDRELELTAA